MMKQPALINIAQKRKLLKPGAFLDYNDSDCFYLMFRMWKL